MGLVFEGKAQCCGCGACSSSCPVQAIEMKRDEEGFLYPQIDEEACVSCGRCRQVCPFHAGRPSEGVGLTGAEDARSADPGQDAGDHWKNCRRPSFYIAKHRSEEVLMSSSSGGAFTALSDAVMADGGVIYGADFDGEFRVYHARAQEPEQRDRMRISKYAQSDLGDVFYQVRRDLQEGRPVLFTGTPCQNAGLKAFLSGSGSGAAWGGDQGVGEQGGGEQGGGDLRNLYLCDIICHSIPSPLVWKDFKELLEVEYGGKLSQVWFRTKERPWSRVNSKETFTFRIAGRDETLIDNRFYDLFFGKMTIMRPSCEVCPFSDIRRVGDVTIADYWGIEKYEPEWNDPRGVSLILVNTDKGKALLERCEDTLIYEERSPEEELSQQPRLLGPVRYPEERKEFWERYKRDGLRAIIENEIDCIGRPPVI